MAPPKLPGLRILGQRKGEPGESQERQEEAGRAREGRESQESQERQGEARREPGEGGRFCYAYVMICYMSVTCPLHVAWQDCVSSKVSEIVKGNRVPRVFFDYVSPSVHTGDRISKSSKALVVLVVWQIPTKDRGRVAPCLVFVRL